MNAPPITGDFHFNSITGQKQNAKKRGRLMRKAIRKMRKLEKQQQVNISPNVRDVQAHTFAESAVPPWIADHLILMDLFNEHSIKQPPEEVISCAVRDCSELKEFIIEIKREDNGLITSEALIDKNVVGRGKGEGENIVKAMAAHNALETLKKCCFYIEAKTSYFGINGSCPGFLSSMAARSNRSKLFRIVTPEDVTNQFELNKVLNKFKICSAAEDLFFIDKFTQGEIDHFATSAKQMNFLVRKFGNNCACVYKKKSPKDVLNKLMSKKGKQNEKYILNIPLAKLNNLYEIASKQKLEENEEKTIPSLFDNQEINISSDQRTSSGQDHIDSSLSKGGGMQQSSLTNQNNKRFYDQGPDALEEKYSPSNKIFKKGFDYLESVGHCNQSSIQVEQTPKEEPERLEGETIKQPQSTEKNQCYDHGADVWLEEDESLYNLVSNPADIQSNEQPWIAPSDEGPNRWEERISDNGNRTARSIVKREYDQEIERTWNKDNPSSNERPNRWEEKLSGGANFIHRSSTYRESDQPVERTLNKGNLPSYNIKEQPPSDIESHLWEEKQSGFSNTCPKGSSSGGLGNEYPSNSDKPSDSNKPSHCMEKELDISNPSTSGINRGPCDEVSYESGEKESNVSNPFAVSTDSRKFSVSMERGFNLEGYSGSKEKVSATSQRSATSTNSREIPLIKPQMNTISNLFVRGPDLASNQAPNNIRDNFLNLPKSLTTGIATHHQKDSAWSKYNTYMGAITSRDSNFQKQKANKKKSKPPPPKPAGITDVSEAVDPCVNERNFSKLLDSMPLPDVAELLTNLTRKPSRKIQECKERKRQLINWLTDQGISWDPRMYKKEKKKRRIV